MKTIAQLQKDANKILVEIRKRENKAALEVQVPFLKSLVGACYVYRDNSFGGNSGKWDVFRRISDYVEIRESFHLVFEEVSVDSNGKSTLLVDSHFAYLNKEWHKQNPFSGFVQCSLSEYNTAKENTLEEMRSQKKLRACLKKTD